MRQVFILLYSLGTGGKTAAVLEQCTMFLGAGLLPTILTFNYDPNFESLVRRLRDQGRLPEGARVINIHSDLRNASTKDDAALWSEAEDNDTTNQLAQDDELAEKHYVRYFDFSGTYRKYRRWDAQGRPVQTTYFQQRRAKLRREYAAGGFCGKEIHYDVVSGKPIEERFFTPDGFCYASRWLHHESGHQQGAYQHDRATGRTQRFADNVPWHTAWLTKHIKSAEQKPVVIAESASAVLKVLNLQDGLADRIYMLHENHFASPFTLGAEIRADHAKGLKRLVEMPALVVLTETQARDIRTVCGDYGNVVVVPNIMRDKRLTTAVPKVPGRIGVFCRLAPQKRIDELLRAMVLVVQEVSTAHLEIYGNGPERDSLEALVDELSIRTHVNFNGHTDNVGEAMAECILTASTSDWEALPLSIGESLAAGTAVVSYDLNYGPRDLIRHGIDGFLVPNRDRRALADRIVELLKDRDRATRMGELGASRMKRDYNQETVMESWHKAMSQASLGKPREEPLVPPQRHVTSETRHIPFWLATVRRVELFTKRSLRAGANRIARWRRRSEETQEKVRR